MENDLHKLDIYVTVLLQWWMNPGDNIIEVNNERFRCELWHSYKYIMDILLNQLKAKRPSLYEVRNYLDVMKDLRMSGMMLKYTVYII